MYDVILKSKDIIHKQSQLLLESNQNHLPVSQQNAIERISRYASQLAITAQQIGITHDQEIILRHEMINILTPIVGYTEMLADGWVGHLNPDQMQHIELIQHAVGMMRQSILSYRKQSPLSESA